MRQTVQYELVDGEYGLITLNRPEKRHAISNEMAVALKEILLQAKQDPVKCLVLTNAGSDMFCSGGDLLDLHSELTPDDAFSVLYPMKEVLYELAAFPVPTIALLNGHALGGGCELATACDFRFAEETADFGFVQSSLGIAPGWGGGTLLYEKVDPNFAFRWLVEANMYSASELQEKGWIHHLYSKGEYDPRQLIQPYLERSIEQMHMFKRQYSNKVSMLALSAQMNEDVRAAANLWGNPQHQEAFKKFIDQKQK